MGERETNFGMRYPLGMILGRFQPFHLEHLRYFRLAWEKSEKVIVGITNPDPSAILEDASSPHRHLPEENPFTFFERLAMIQDTLREEGFPMERIYITPLPIHNPERWRYYIPDGTAIFVVAYSPWEKKKAERLRSAGFEVVVAGHLDKKISGQKIRSLIQSNGDWERMVPPAVARFMRGKLGSGK